MSMMAIAGLLITGLWVFLVLRVNKLPTPSSLPARVGINRQQYDAAMESIEQTLARGEINEELAEQERSRLQLQLVRSAEADSRETQWAPTISAPARVAFLILPLSVAVLVFFATGGSMHWHQSAEETAATTAPDIQQMVARLADRLDKNPDDPTGWVMLGRSYMIMQRYDDAAKAWHEANTRAEQPQPDFLVAEAEAIGLSQNQSLEGRPTELIQQALKIDPQNIRGLWFYALAAQARGEEELAFGTLERLAQVPNLPQELIQTLTEIGVDVPNSQPVTATDTATADYALNIEVKLSDALAAKTPPGSTIFVFARTSTGMPMPVAAQRLPLGTWPASVVLDDSKSMMAGRLMSEQTDLEIVARISSSGTAKASPGDWEGRTRWTNKPGGGQVSVTVDKVVP